MEDPYTILGLPPTATLPEIKKAFRRLARALHPDVSSSPSDHARFRAARRAYEQLVHPSASHSPPPPRPEPPPPPARRRGPWRQPRLGLWDPEDEATRFPGRITDPARYDLDALLTREEARAGLTIPFRFHLGPRLVAENLEVPPGVQSGDELTYHVSVAPGVILNLVVHVDIAA